MRNFASGLWLFCCILKFPALRCTIDLLSPAFHCHFDTFGGYSLSRTFPGVKNAGRSALLLAHKTTKHSSRCRERQLSGGAVDEDAKEMLATEEDMVPEQICLLDKLMTWPTSLSLEAEWRRRSEAINAVTAYCGVEAGGSRRGRKPKRLDQDAGRLASEEAQSTFPLKATLEHRRQATRPHRSSENQCSQTAQPPTTVVQRSQRNRRVLYNTTNATAPHNGCVGCTTEAKWV